MSFTLSKILWTFADPAHLMLAMLLIAVWLLFAGGRAAQRTARRLVAIVAVVLLTLTVTPLADLLATPLENRFPQISELPVNVAGIIVLGGAVSPPLTVARGQPAVNGAAERLLTFADLARRYPGLRLAATGGSGSLVNQTDTEDVPTAQALAQMGLDPARVVFENRSRNTYENAVLSREMVKPAPGEVWALVTSAMHMPRSVGLFRQAGWTVVAVPVDYRTRGDGQPWLRFDLIDNLTIFSAALREWLGLAAHHWSGWSDSLFPGPGSVL